MELVTAAQMARIDRRTSADYGIPSLVLMEQAGYHVACLAADIIRRQGGRPRPVAVMAGKGNNGGDGLVAARYLHQWGFALQVVLVGDPAALGGDPAVNLRALRAVGVPVTAAAETELEEMLAGADLVIDALLGTGLKGAAAGETAAAIEAINAAGRPVLAVDVPSGLDADTGTAAGPCIRASWTVTMSRPKLGNALHPGAAYGGELVVAPIPIPDAAVAAEGVETFLLTRRRLADMLPPRPVDAHKGTFGHVLVIGGSTGYGGAPFLAATAALRGGAGLVSLACPAAVARSAFRAPEVMVHPLAGAPDHLSPEVWPGIQRLTEEATVLCVGPGLGRHSATKALLETIISSADKPLVLDADGLNLLGLDPIASYRGPVVITPHPGEAARLLGIDAAEVQADRPAAARRLVAAMAGPGPRVAVLKGAGTVIAGDDGRVFVNPTGSSALATGGTGDALAGVIAALLAQGTGHAEAAAAGVFVHGLAGEQAARWRSGRSVTAGDVVAQMGAAFRAVEEDQGVEGLDAVNTRLFPLIWLNDSAGGR